MVHFAQKTPICHLQNSTLSFPSFEVFVTNTRDFLFQIYWNLGSETVLIFLSGTTQKKLQIIKAFCVVRFKSSRITAEEMKNRFNSVKSEI